MLRKFIIVGDFNLNGIDWSSGYTRSSIEREFLNGFRPYPKRLTKKVTFLTYYLPHLLAI